MSCRITTHILDLQRGLPASNVEVEILVREGVSWQSLSTAYTNEDGRITQWNLQVAGPESDQLVPLDFEAGQYQLRFATADYFKLQGITPAFFPAVTIEFLVDQTRPHYHVPLLLSPFGYSTYRGS